MDYNDGGLNYVKKLREAVDSMSAEELQHRFGKIENRNEPAFFWCFKDIEKHSCKTGSCQTENASVQLRTKEINLDRALLFCQQGHNSINQMRKYTDEPYWVHPLEVMEMVRSVPHTKEMLAAALFHDLVEDTPITLEDIRLEFGNEVASLVEMLTDTSKPTDGNRKIRKNIDLQHTANASPNAKTIKLADLISNTSSIVEFDPNFARVYLKEKAALLEVLKDGDKTLYDRAYQLMVDSELKLKHKREEITLKEAMIRLGDN